MAKFDRKRHMYRQVQAKHRNILMTPRTHEAMTELATVKPSLHSLAPAGGHAVIVSKLQSQNQKYEI